MLVWSYGPQEPWEAPVCAIAGNLPDFDRNVAKAMGVKRRDHHRWVSHSLIGWLPPTVAALALARRSPRGGTIRRAVACVWLHLLLDSYADGVAWLWPLHKEKIGLFVQPGEIKDAGWSTPAPLHTNLGQAEASFWLATAANVVSERSAD